MPGTRRNSDEKVVSNKAAEDFRRAALEGTLTEAEKDVLHVWGMEEIRDRELTNEEEDRNKLETAVHNLCTWVNEDDESIDDMDFEKLYAVAIRAKDKLMEWASTPKERKDAYNQVAGMLWTITAKEPNDYQISYEQYEYITGK